MEQTKLNILAKYEVTLCEYQAMLCPYYGILMNPKKMAVHTVLEVHGSPDGEFAADDYLTAINDMIEKGWLTIAKKQDCIEKKKNPEIPEQEDFYDIHEGDVIFTKNGYLLHRNILNDLRGSKFLHKHDSFFIINSNECCINFYGETEGICNDWLFDINQKTTGFNLSDIVGNPVDVTNISKPVTIGKWRPSPFLLHEKGYCCSITYKRKIVSRKKISAKKLNLIATIKESEPIFISGTIGGEDFSFSECVSWLSEKMDDNQKISDDSAVFNWLFQIEEKSSIQTPENAHLTGEEPTKSGFLIPNYKFTLKEQDDRTNMLTIDESKILLKQCCKKYLDSKKAKST